MNEVFLYLSVSANWLNWPTLIQMGTAVLIGLGFLIAMDDKRSQRITARDNLGTAMLVIGLAVFGIFTLPGLLGLGALAVLGLLVSVVLFVLAIRWNLKRMKRSR